MLWLSTPRQSSRTISALLGPVRASEGQSRTTCTQKEYEFSIAHSDLVLGPSQGKAVLRCWPRPPFACAAGVRTHAGSSSRYEGVGAPGSQLPDFMHTREPLLLNARGMDGRDAARAMKAEEVMVLDIMMGVDPAGSASELMGAAGECPS